MTPDVRYPAVEGEIMVDTAIIGGGFTGLSSALHLLGGGGEVFMPRLSGLSCLIDTLSFRADGASMLSTTPHDLAVISW